MGIPIKILPSFLTKRSMSNDRMFLVEIFLTERLRFFSQSPSPKTVSLFKNALTPSSFPTISTGWLRWLFPQSSTVLVFSCPSERNAANKKKTATHRNILDRIFIYFSSCRGVKSVVKFWSSNDRTIQESVAFGYSKYIPPKQTGQRFFSYGSLFQDTARPSYFPCDRLNQRLTRYVSHIRFLTSHATQCDHGSAL